MPKRYYTVDEANEALQTLRPLMARLLAARQRIVDAQPDLWPVLEKAVGNGGGKKAGAVLADFEQVQQAVKTIEQMGIELKDVNTGLIDFWALRDGREVYLCWRYNEPAVAFWHDLQAGFAGRQPL